MKFLLIMALVLINVSCVEAREGKEVNSRQNDDEIKKSPVGLFSKFTPDKDEILGKILEQTLENVHYLHKEVNDDLSKKAFKLYLERVDYGKQFLTEDDVEKLEKYEKKFDDMLKNGDQSVVLVTERIMNERIPMVEEYVLKILKKDFDYNKNESYETDAKKRKFVDDIDEIKERWRKLVKMEVLIQYFELKEEQDGTGEKKDKKKKKISNKDKKKKNGKKLSYAELMKESREKVAKRYTKVFKRLREERKNDRLDKFYNSITKVYDPHTHYLMPEEKEDFDIDMSGKLEGIGALLREEGSFIKVERIIPGSASWKGKELKAEDVILAVGQADDDPVDIVDMSIRDAVKLIRGKKGTVVKLKVKKPDGHIEVIAITRDEVILEESFVKSTVITHKTLGKKIGYIHVPKFYRDFNDPVNGRNCSTDVRVEIEKLKNAGVEGIILNLRNNGGGALQDATLMSGLFFDSGPVVQVKNRGEAKIHRDTDGKTYWDKPVIVLINRFSASASEIVAGALKDYKRAVIVGSSEQTHGKGTVQAILPLQDVVNPLIKNMLPPIGAMKITTDMFYRINGMSTQFRGVKPDIILPDQYGYLESGEQSLDFAIPYTEVPAVKFKEWKKQKYDISKLSSNSKKRVGKNSKFQKIESSVKWSKERKENTKRSLTIKDMEKFRKDAHEISEKYKVDEENPLIAIDHLKKPKNEVEKESFKEFEEELKKDPVIEETLYIMSDLLAQK